MLFAALAGAADGWSDPPPFEADAYQLAAWTLTLRVLVSPTGATGPLAYPADLSALVRRIEEIAPHMPDGALRETMIALRRVLEERSTSQVVRTSQLSLTN